MAIDIEFNSLLQYGTWKYIEKTSEMKPVPNISVFRFKVTNSDWTEHLYEGRCVARGYLNIPPVDFDPETLYQWLVISRSERS